jgi:RHS repeat-associated protein
VQSGTTTYFPHVDWLGTKRAVTNLSGTRTDTCASLPFGDALSCTGTDNFPTHFTGQVHDNESNLDHFLFRQYTSTQGRWMHPDPAGLAAVDPGNPQTWNRYAYVNNNPLSYIDPFGLTDCPQNKTCPCPYDACVIGQPPDPIPPVNPPGYPPPCDNCGPSNPPPTGPPGPGNPAKNCTPGTKGCFNVPTARQQCLNQFYNSALGSGVQFLSPLQMIPGWGQAPQKSILETAIGLGTKATVLTAAAGVGQPVIQALSTDGWNLAGPIEQFLGWAGSNTLSFAKVAGPLAWGSGAGLDVLAHVACALDPNSSGEGIPVAPK